MFVSQLSLAALSLLIVASTVKASDLPIAGLDPSQRPEGAPRILTVNRSGEWYRGALHGVARPYPHSLRFLEDQGNWYTPFTRPGMPGRYDIRGWYGQ